MRRYIHSLPPSPLKCNSGRCSGGGAGRACDPALPRQSPEILRNPNPNFYGRRYGRRRRYRRCRRYRRYRRHLWASTIASRSRIGALRRNETPPNPQTLNPQEGQLRPHLPKRRTGGVLSFLKPKTLITAKVQQLQAVRLLLVRLRAAVHAAPLNWRPLFPHPV